MFWLLSGASEQRIFYLCCKNWVTYPWRSCLLRQTRCKKWTVKLVNEHSALKLFKGANYCTTVLKPNDVIGPGSCWEISGGQVCAFGFLAPRKPRRVAKPRAESQSTYLTAVISEKDLGFTKEFHRGSQSFPGPDNFTKDVYLRPLHIAGNKYNCAQQVHIRNIEVNSLFYCDTASFSAQNMTWNACTYKYIHYIHSYVCIKTSS